MTKTDLTRPLALALAGSLIVSALAMAKEKPRPVVYEWVEQPVLCLPMSARIMRLEDGKMIRHTPMEAIADSAFRAGIIGEVGSLGLTWTLAEDAALARDSETPARLTVLQDVLAELTRDLAPDWRAAQQAKGRADDAKKAQLDNVQAGRSTFASTGDLYLAKFAESKSLKRMKQKIESRLNASDQANLAAALTNLTTTRYVAFPTYYGFSKDLRGTAGAGLKLMGNIAAGLAASALGGEAQAGEGGLASGEYDLALYIFDLKTGDFVDQRILTASEMGAGMKSENRAMDKRFARFMKPAIKQIKKENKLARKQLAKLEAKGK